MRKKAEGYGMPSASVDGMDVIEVRRGAEEALGHVRTNGPYFLEVVTYRFRGHSMGDPERYRKGEEVRRWQEEDPIGRFRKHLISSKTAKESELDALEAEVELEIESAVRFAEESPEPGPEELFADIYVEEMG
jgi:pyruvate dehydrogenase E1 component alpha subunit